MLAVRVVLTLLKAVSHTKRTRIKLRSVRCSTRSTIVLPSFSQGDIFLVVKRQFVYTLSKLLVKELSLILVQLITCFCFIHDKCTKNKAKLPCKETNYRSITQNRFQEIFVYLNLPFFVFVLPLCSCFNQHRLSQTYPL
jgi:hypothetical protein